ncbi:uncharacterized protein LOC119402289 isoform X2 [Rhipicephalus sanguineus]|uniref:uncharacterized protein LOC119402289 isoform X2 n=1 Tax=Rhipicephalus sanguineus TaxID=34632 RepID=UPI0020C1CEEB|nr:uncharacterized protein LOC119402289 isoform X2 [Rhipicephalus sanguineus]
MKYSSATELWYSCSIVIFFSLPCDTTDDAHAPNGALYRGRKELNLLEVLNTSMPLYLYYFCNNMGIPECHGEECFKETYTCEHWRKRELTNTTYNFTDSLLNESLIWENTTYDAEILQTPWPPTEMRYNDTTENKVSYIIDMNLTYNEPDTYNCSVFDVIFPQYQLIGVTTTAMYIRGSLPNGTLPPEYCQIHFLTYCHNTTIFKPYNWNCSLREEQQHEETNEQEGEAADVNE